MNERKLVIAVAILRSSNLAIDGDDAYFVAVA